MLFLISTPIGNLSDITYRAVETLKTCDLILCEDTRVSRVLLKAYDIHKSLLSFHAFNERKREEKVIEALHEGQTVGLISDAGTPAICDPGARLVERCYSEEIAVSVIPGPSALIAALSLSGYIKERFQFVGYLPKKGGSLKRQLNDMLSYDGLSIAYETPHHLLKTLELLSKSAPKTPLFLVKELTKKYETSFKGTAEKLFETLSQKQIKGEWVMIIYPLKKGLKA